MSSAGGAVATLRASEGANGSSNALEALARQPASTAAAADAANGSASGGRKLPALRFGKSGAQPQTPPPTFDALSPDSLQTSKVSFEVRIQPTICCTSPADADALQVKHLSCISHQNSTR